MPCGQLRKIADQKSEISLSVPVPFVFFSSLDQTNLPRLDAFDFSLWLSYLIKSNDTKLHIKVSMPGAEVALLQKMILDNTLALAEEWDIEWSDQTNPHLRPSRYYVQQMLDSLGYSFQYHTTLHDAREVFNMKGAYKDVKKHSDLRLPSEADTYTHYFRRPDVPDPLHTTKSKLHLKKS